MSADIREDIEAAIDQVAAGGSDAPAAPASPSGDGADASAGVVGGGDSNNGGDKPDAAATVGGARNRDPHGRFARGAPVATAKPAAGAAPPPPPASPGAAPPEAGKAPEAAAAPVAELRAPSSWKPLAREKWASIAPEAQQEILRLDKEVRQTMQEAAPARRFASEFQQAIAPFEGMIRAEGSSPLQAVSNLLQTYGALRTAPPAHKAQMVASLVRNFGVPLEALDAALAGEAPQPGQQQAGPYQDPRVDQLLQTIEQAKQQRTTAVRQQVDSQLAEFAKGHEFFEDVRDHMADLVDVYAKRGVALSPQEAYNKAVQLHPELSEVMKQREAAKAAANAQASTQRTRAAASSVKSQPAGPVTQAQPDDLRSVIKAAMAGSQGR